MNLESRNIHIPAGSTLKVRAQSCFSYTVKQPSTKYAISNYQRAVVLQQEQAAGWSQYHMCQFLTSVTPVIPAENLLWNKLGIVLIAIVDILQQAATQGDHTSMGLGSVPWWWCMWCCNDVYLLHSWGHALPETSSGKHPGVSSCPGTSLLSSFAELPLRGQVSTRCAAHSWCLSVTFRELDMSWTYEESDQRKQRR